MSETVVQAQKKRQHREHKRAATVYARELPATGYVRLETVLVVFPIGRSTWWKGIKAGRYPAGVKLGPRLTAWRVEDLRALLERTAKGRMFA